MSDSQNSNNLILEGNKEEIDRIKEIFKSIYQNKPFRWITVTLLSDWNEDGTIHN